MIDRTHPSSIRLAARGIRISMDGKGRWVENVCIERLWKSVKYDEVYLKAYSSIAEAGRELGAYFEFYNQRRRHPGLDHRTPDEVYYSSRPMTQAAA
jgi:putative transposase